MLYGTNCSARDIKIKINENMIQNREFLKPCLQNKDKNNRSHMRDNQPSSKNRCEFIISQDKGKLTITCSTYGLQHAFILYLSARS
jgi:hypothetical protein